ncbi:NADH-dependent formate dehydrogenase delta subunit FdsD [Leptothrix ochracea L12]|uniref:NADH-dependent formate dehydrogenase delta subunit FdsD n=1 Tax=Leptothrix ochracea L12 TaxID=735332 RepID=I4Z648_9BURK|nr:formate dehydrogenase subunit delta [Leptothrix ochracea]EIM31690.1 NADH-dependent formate dehydrogenase delta subunit FdsD [Leptothrix ochracea L12]
MDVNHLIQMANRIGDFFAAMPDHSEALEGIALHLEKFWEPRMRRQLLQGLEHGDAVGDTLHPLVVEAIQRHRAAIDPGK